MPLNHWSLFTWTYGVHIKNALKENIDISSQLLMTILHIWIYLLQYRSNSLATLQIFLNYVQTCFSKVIKYLRPDNALEFDNGPCILFFASHGIIHQTSYVKRPKQNAQAERKPRYIHEINIDLKFQAGWPVPYWEMCPHCQWRIQEFEIGWSHYHSPTTMQRTIGSFANNNYKLLQWFSANRHTDK